MALVKYNNNSLSAVTTTAGMPAGAMTLIKTVTASASGTISFVDGTSDVVLDSTYPIYVFKYINMHPSGDASPNDFTVNFRDGGSAYDATKTSTFYWAYQTEAGDSTTLGYSSSNDLGQATGTQPLTGNSGNDNDQCSSGTLHLFNPSSTTFVKHFMSTSNMTEAGDYSINSYVAGYCNVTAAIDGVQFAYQNGGTIDSGTIKLYGIKDS